jgi:hypothetical protein
MHVAIYLPLIFAAVLGATATHLSRTLPPATATRLLTAAGVATAAATSFVLAVLAFTLLAELPPVAELGSWSTPALDAVNPIPDSTSAVAVATVCLLAMIAVRVAVLRVRASRAARRLCAQLGGGPGDLVVVDGPEVEVFAVPALHGRIVATRPLLSRTARRRKAGRPRARDGTPAPPPSPIPTRRRPGSGGQPAAASAGELRRVRNRAVGRRGGGRNGR